MAFSLKYKNSSFPFKQSPVKILRTETSDEKVIEVNNDLKEAKSSNAKQAIKSNKERKVASAIGNFNTNSNQSASSSNAKSPPVSAGIGFMMASVKDNSDEKIIDA
tara:strand:+ start:258 stop:575 length:318 start_codon:yes stop_codon:yes gene_type:complete